MERIRVDFAKLVSDVAERFQSQHGIPVNPGARYELVKRALPYQDQVELELSSGKITTEFLEQSIYTVLENAAEIARERGRTAVGEDTTEESMKKYCPYLFWC